ncbi:hypothetical protein HYN43_010195 [Mucilaginibacter celer]|uniref:Ig-like domain-containing protein n=2 Tax=Mucilaginibacter celer TaxID=2305508 RepID=A0A494VN98_9SPHI|nr:hypothetical protein HYN43_010195 [Mucilaginibacter celer]
MPIARAEVAPVNSKSKKFENSNSANLHKVNIKPAPTVIVFVTQNGAGLKNGSSWANAYSTNELHSALFNATSGMQFWIAAGAYNPIINGSGTYKLKSGVSIYGGFAGYETQLSQRDPSVNITLLTGASYQLMYALDLTEPALIDGVTMTTRATVLTTFGRVGGALWVSGGDNLLTVNNVTFKNNLAGKGAGIYILHSSPNITNCTFTNNTASATAVTGGAAAGGAIAIACARENTTSYGSHGPSNPTITNCKFTNNTAGYGSAIYMAGEDIYNDAGNKIATWAPNPVITNCVFSNNYGSSTVHIVLFSYDQVSLTRPRIQKSVFYQNQGNSIVNDSRGMSLTTEIYNCLFTGNNQPAIYNTSTTNSTVTSNACTPVIVNSTFYAQPAISNFNASPYLWGDILWGSNNPIYNFEKSFPQVKYSIVQGGYAGTGNLNADPVFVNTGNLIGSDNVWGTADDGLMLLPCSSPAINAGTLVSQGPTSDIRGVAWLDNPDMGAYEQNSTRLTPVIAITTSSRSICAGTPVTFTSATRYAGDKPVYQWQKNGINVGFNSATYTDSTLTDNSVITCLLTSSDACSIGQVTSNSLVMTVNPVIKPGISIAGSASSVCPGTPVTFTATPVNPGSYASYQWLRNGKNTGTNALTYTASFTTTDTIRCIITTNTDCTVPRTAVSNSIVMGIKPQLKPQATITASATTIIPKTKVTFTAKVVNGGTKPLYSWIKNGVTVGQNQATYIDSLLKGSEHISCIVTGSGDCPLTDTSNVVTINMVAPQISSFSPANAVSGTSIIIKGKYLTNTSSVKFGGTAAASFVVNSDTQITAVVGIGSSGDVTVVTPGGPASASGFVYQLNQTVTFASIPAKTTNAADFDPGATSSSGLPVAYTFSNTKVASLVNGKIHILSTGSVTITATQAGDSKYAKATASQLLIVSSPGVQVITFATPAPVSYGMADFDAGATSNAGLPVLYSSSDTTIANIINNKVHITGVGKVNITASQPGNEAYNKATSLTRILTINKGNQSISFDPLESITYGYISGTTAKASASSGLPVIFSSADTTIAKVSSNQIFPFKAGVVNITASQPGNNFYNAATPVVQSLTIYKQYQYISIQSYGYQTFGTADFEPGLYISSKLKPTYSSSDTTVVSISAAGLLHMKGVGTTTITVTQAGNESYYPANAVTQLLTISKGGQTITFPAMQPVQFASADFIPNAVSSSGLALSFTSSDTTRAKIVAGKIRPLKVGTVTITATQAGNNNYTAATKVTQLLTVVKSDQSINFATPSAAKFGDAPFTLVATSGSGLAVSFVSSDTSVVRISAAGLVTLRKPGSVTIIASQAGSANYNAAAPVSRTFSIGKGDQQITFAALAPKTFGDAAITPGAISSSKLLVDYSSSDTSVAVISAGRIVIKNGGQVTITATQAGNDFYNPAPAVSRQLSIGRAAQTITFAALTAKVFGSADFALTAFSSSRLPVTYTSSNTAVATVTNGVVHIIGAGTATITASQTGNSKYAAATQVSQLLTVSKAVQTITFAALPAKYYLDTDFYVSAVSTAGLPASFSIADTTVARFINGKVHIIKAGITNIIATQAGNGNYSAAVPVTRAFTVGKAPQNITFSTLPSKQYGDGDFSISAISSSGLPVSFSIRDTTVARINNGVIHILRAGTTTVLANQAGNSNYNAALTISQILNIGKANQSINFAALPAAKFGDAPFTLVATSGSGLAVSFVSSDTSVVRISAAGLVTLRKPGSATITASQAGSANYNAAAPVSRTLSIGKGDQQITFAALAPKTFGDAAITPGAISSSKLLVDYSSSDTSVAVISAGRIVIKNGGQVTITATQVGNDFYNPAPAVSRQLSIGRAAQTITFAALTAKVFGSVDFALTAFSSSRLPVTYTSSNTAVATVTNGVVHITGAGTATITASQTGNSKYAAATQVSQLLTVSKAVQTITFAALPAKYYLDTDFYVSAVSTAGLPVSFSIADTTVARFINGKVHIIKAGITNIIATQAGNGNYSAAVPVTRAFTVGKAPQNITFSTLPSKQYGDGDFSISAISSSGLPVSFSIRDTTVARINNGVIHILRAGTTTILANQAGNSNYNAALTISQTLNIGKANQSINFVALPAAKFGDAPFTLSATSGSGLAVSFASSDTSVIRIGATGLVTLLKPGSVTIIASQAGSANYNAAAPVSRTLSIGKGDQQISFAALAPKTFGDAAITPGAISSSKLLVDYSSSDTSVAVISAGRIVIKNGGQATITATQAGNDFYNPAPAVSQQLSIGRAAQTITFAALTAKVFGSVDFALTAFSSSRLPVTYTSSNTAVATVTNGVVHITGAGTATITASQTGNSKYAAATPVSQLLTVSKATQTITFAAITNVKYGSADIQLNAAASSKLTVSNYVSSNTSVATIVNGRLHVINAGSVIITANQAGNSNYNAANPVSITVSIAKAPLTITAGNKTKVSGADNPVFTATYTGFLNGDTTTSLLTPPIFKATTTASPGAYPIIVSGATAANYVISFVNGTLTVTAKPATGISQPRIETTAAKTPDNIAYVKTEPTVRGALSPNGDGINDVLIVDGLEAYPDNTLTILNLSGVKIYEAKAYDNANKTFDGHSNITGVMQKPGTYFYLLEYKDNGETNKKSGYIIIKY